MTGVQTCALPICNNYSNNSNDRNTLFDDKTGVNISKLRNINHTNNHIINYTDKTDFKNIPPMISMSPNGYLHKEECSDNYRNECLSARKKQHSRVGFSDSREYDHRNINRQENESNEIYNAEEKREAGNSYMDEDDHTAKKKIESDFRTVLRGARALILPDSNSRNHYNKRRRDGSEDRGTEENIDHRARGRPNPIEELIVPYVIGKKSKINEKDRNLLILMGPGSSVSETVPIISGRPIIKRSRKILPGADDDVLKQEDLEDIDGDRGSLRFLESVNRRVRRKSEVHRAVRRFLGGTAHLFLLFFGRI